MTFEQTLLKDYLETFNVTPDNQLKATWLNLGYNLSDIDKALGKTTDYKFDTRIGYKTHDRP